MLDLDSYVVGIALATPVALTVYLHSLPTILHT